MRSAIRIQSGRGDCEDNGVKKESKDSSAEEFICAAI